MIPILLTIVICLPVCRYAEVLLLVMFLLLILLWLFREPRFIKGWGIIFRQEEDGSS